jgi:uncharacterized protein (TIGR00369 family)
MSPSQDSLDKLTFDNYQTLLQQVPYAQFVGIQCAAYGEALIFSLPASAENLGNPILPALHGGVLAGFMETAAAVQLMVSSQRVKIPKIVNISIDYLSAGYHQDTFAECSITRQGKRVANVSIIAWQTRQSKPLAVARTHFLLR